MEEDPEAPDVLLRRHEEARLAAADELRRDVEEVALPVDEGLVAGLAAYCAFCRHRDRELARTAATPDDEESKEFESEVALDVMSKNI